MSLPTARPRGSTRSPRGTSSSADAETPAPRASTTPASRGSTRGQPGGAAATVFEELERARGAPFSEADRIEEVLWGEVPIADAESEAKVIEARNAGPSPLPVGEVFPVLTAEIWRYMTDPAHVDGGTAARIRTAKTGARVTDMAIEADATLLEAWSLVRAGDAGSRATLDRLDDIIRQGPGGTPGTEPFMRPTGIPYEVDIWQRQGHLAALAGDTPRAIALYERYLKFRAHTDPDLQPEIEAVRAELERLRAG